jgi:hypothetical protein
VSEAADLSYLDRAYNPVTPPAYRVAMDPFKLVVCRAFSVPDLLSEENQSSAAAAALARHANFDATGRPDLYPPIKSADLMASVLRHRIEVITELLRAHSFDALIGQYGDEEAARASAIKQVRDKTFDLDAASIGVPPDDVADALASTVVDVIVTWTRDNPRALRRALRDCEPR